MSKRSDSSFATGVEAGRKRAAIVAVGGNRTIMDVGADAGCAKTAKNRVPLTRLRSHGVKMIAMTHCVKASSGAMFALPSNPAS